MAELDLREGRTAEFHRGRIHSCCQAGTMEHMTTCHHCGQRGEGMYDGNVGEPVCKGCAQSIQNQSQPELGEQRHKIVPWREQ